MMQKLRIGIFFGGSSREREISFAGGRTVYDNLNKTLFEPVLIFVDSHNTLIKLNWEYIYKGTIRDFFPPMNFLPQSDSDSQLYIESLDLDEDQYSQAINTIGSKLEVSDLKETLDVAFLALHGKFGEDGTIQGLLDFINIPYTGSDVSGSGIGMNKALQKYWMSQSKFDHTASVEISRSDWLDGLVNYDTIVNELSFPFVVRPAHQGSSIGVSILNQNTHEEFTKSVDAAFFRQNISSEQWQSKSSEEQRNYLRSVTDTKSGIGLPLYAGDQYISLPSQLRDTLNNLDGSIYLQAVDSEHTVICESFIEGKEFSCVVTVDDDGAPYALPPTEIVKGEEVYDYQSKYMPGRSRKVTPIDISTEAIKLIQEECINLYSALKFKVYARIDGFYTQDGKILLNDPNTTSGMLPSSFFFHQAAELGLDPSEFITNIIRNSIAERGRYGLELKRYSGLLEQLDTAIQKSKSENIIKKRVGVILGGYSFERHISVESGRNIYEKLASSDKYEPIPLFLFGDGHSDFKLYQIPINILLKDNADDIKENIANYQIHETTAQLRRDKSHLIKKYMSNSSASKPLDVTDQLKDVIDIAFIALHGRPGEDGTIQKFLDAQGIPYNGSGPESSSLTIDKYSTLQLLKENGFIVADQLLYNRTDYEGKEDWYHIIEEAFNYPFIVKPVDDGCSSAVVKIKSRDQLALYLNAIFRVTENLTTDLRTALNLAVNEEFPKKSVILIESLIGSNGAAHFMEITGGMLFHQLSDGSHEIEIFEPSEVLAGDEILSLEEKFLAGQGQNLTPARFSADKSEYKRIAQEVKKTLEKAAQLLNVQGYCRIDAFVRIYEDGSVETILIEINSLPGMTPATCIFHQCSINDYKPYDFINKILNFGEARVNPLKVYN